MRSINKANMAAHRCTRWAELANAGCFRSRTPRAHARRKRPSSSKVVCDPRHVKSFSNIVNWETGRGSPVGENYLPLDSLSRRPGAGRLRFADGNLADL